MVKFVTALIFSLILVASPVLAAWNTNGLQTDPGAGQVLADTGALSAGTTTYTLLIFADAPTLIEIQHRNATNTANVDVQTIQVESTRIYSIPVTLLLSERIRVVSVSGFIGQMQVSILTSL